MSKEDSTSGTEVLTKNKTRTKTPRLYRVLLLNDDYTTMDFVVAVLENIFHKSPSEATRIMLEVHKKGSGVCGSYTREIAETKVDVVHRYARESGYPLRALSQPE